MNYKELTVWQKSIALVKEIYIVTRQLPTEEKYGLSDQLRRAAVSIPSNIAEGQKRLGKAESIRFASIAIGSAAEVETQLIIVQELYGLDTSPQQQQVCEIERLLSGLIRSLR
ncbi:four helix bundle protein [Candidatus Saccharibacteria bacterium]|nr:four helix bundle protein [Candidatus Saccharibacteria bacterium]